MILNNQLKLLDDVISCLLDEVVSCWSKGHDFQPPVGVRAIQQKSWDHLRVAAANQLVESAMNDIDIAHLLASSAKESGAWLYALPISALGIWLDDDSLTIAVGVHLGTPLSASHQCSHCGEEVDVKGKYGLSCRWSEGRHHRHAAINDIIHCALTFAGVPARLEPPGLLRSDGKLTRLFFDGTVEIWKVCGVGRYVY